MKKRLIIFIPSIEGGGVEKNLFAIVNFLSKRIPNISLITTNKECKKELKKIKIISPKYFDFSKTSRVVKYVACLIELTRIILKDRKILIFSFQANLYCIIICAIFNIKIIIRSNSSPSGWAKNSLKIIIFKIILKLANKIIVNSYDFKKELKKKFKIKSMVIYNPLNKNEIIKKSKVINNFSFFGKSKKILKIISVGRLVPQKDHMTFLKSLKILKKKIIFKALILGRGIEREKLQNFIEKEKLIEDIKIIKFQKNPYKYIKLANILVLTSRFEGLPNVLLEGLALKKFIISSNCPTGPREILNNGKSGILFKIGDEYDLAKKINFYFLNKKKLKRKINHGYNQLARFDYNKNLNKYLNVVNLGLTK